MFDLTALEPTGSATPRPRLPVLRGAASLFGGVGVVVAKLLLIAVLIGAYAPIIPVLEALEILAERGGYDSASTGLHWSSRAEYAMRKFAHKLCGQENGDAVVDTAAFMGLLVYGFGAVAAALVLLVIGIMFVDTHL